MPALIFDCDGVLADTERFGHLPAFNQTFAEIGLPARWSEEDYAKLLLIGGGKERMSSMLTPEFIAEAGLPDDPDELAKHVAEWHRRKTDAYTTMVDQGALPPRPGVRRLAEEAYEDGWQLAVASTSAERSVAAVLNHAVGAELAARFTLFAGDVVARKKPAPDIYQMAISQLRVSPEDGIAVEDSRNGMLAAIGAGLTCIVTTSSYTRDEDFTGAAFVVTSLGDPASAASGAEVARTLSDPYDVRPSPVVNVSHLHAVLSAAHADSPTQQGQTG